jgi:hypothetical protein
MKRWGLFGAGLFGLLFAAFLRLFGAQNEETGLTIPAVVVGVASLLGLALAYRSLGTGPAKVKKVFVALTVVWAILLVGAYSAVRYSTCQYKIQYIEGEMTSSDPYWLGPSGPTRESDFAALEYLKDLEYRERQIDWMGWWVSTTRQEAARKWIAEKRRKVRRQ